MSRRSITEDLSEEQIQFLLWKKLQAARTERLQHYRKTGRIVQLVPDVNSPSLDTFHTSSVAEQKAQLLLKPGKRFANRLLLCLEWVSIAGFALVLVTGLSVLRNLNQEYARVFDLPTLTPTPIIRAAEIPSAHVHTDSSGGERATGSGIPPHLLPIVQVFANIPLPTQVPEYAIRIRIPAIDVDAPIVQGDAWEQLKEGVAQRPGSAAPGKKGNMVLSGHNDIFGEVFRYLDRLEPGDEVTIYTPQRSYTYIISGWELVEPDRVDVMDPTPTATITLISCYPYLIDSQRIIVRGLLAG